MQEEYVTFSLDPLIQVLRDQFGAHEDTFEDIINPLLPEYEKTRNALQTYEAELDEHVRFISLNRTPSDANRSLCVLVFLGEEC